MAFLLPFDVKPLFFDKPHEPRFVQLLRNREAHDHVGSKVSLNLWSMRFMINYKTDGFLLKKKNGEIVSHKI